MQPQINKFKIYLTSGDTIYVKVPLELIEVVDWLTYEKTTMFYELDHNKPTIIFRKHIVKITEVK